MPSNVRVLTQSSKAGAIPNDYVMLAGDSYALGNGDWFSEANYNLNPPFHSAHVIHSLTGKDVISFGRGGADNITGLAVLPRLGVEDVQRSLAFDLADPETILVYFYEGNDWIDNLNYLDRHQYKKSEATQIIDELSMDAFITERVRKKRIPRNIRHFTPFLMTTLSMVLIAYENTIASKNLFVGEQTRPEKSNNPSLIRNKIPELLQGPSPMLTNIQIQDAAKVFERSLKYLDTRINLHILHPGAGDGVFGWFFSGF